MPVLETELRSATRSALRYRPVDADQKPSAPVVPHKRRSRAETRTTSAPAVSDDLVKGYPARQRAVAEPKRRLILSIRTGQRLHPLLFVGLGLLAMLFLWVGISQVVNWGKNEMNTLKYGNPRTFQIDAVVGHGDSELHPSHFIALNLHGVVTIIEFPAGYPGRAHVLATTSLLGSHADQAVVTLSFIDVNHNGKPDMLINIDGVENVLVNDGTGFRPPTPAEQQRILDVLR